MAITNAVEHLTITATDNDSTPGNFLIADASTIDSLIIRNVSANPCYVTWSNTSAPTATSLHFELLPGASHSLNDVSFIYFAIINKTAGRNGKVIIAANYDLPLFNPLSNLYNGLKDIIGSDFTEKTGLDVNDIKIGKVEEKDLGRFGQGFLTIVPATDEHEEYLAQMDERKYTVQLSYYRTFQRLTIIEMDILTEFGERLRRILVNNSDYSPSGIYKWHGGVVDIVDYTQDLSDIEEFSEEPIQGVSVVRFVFSVITATEFV